MASVWYVGPNVSRRTIKRAAWIRALGDGDYDDTTWSYLNGWSVPESAFSTEQIEHLDSLTDFLTNQIDGPRTWPPPPPDPDPAQGGNAFVYWAALVSLYGTVLEIIDGWVPGEGGGTATWASLTGKPSTFPPSAHTQTMDTIDGLLGALGDRPTLENLATTAADLSAAIGTRATPADIATAVSSLTTLINARVETSVYTAALAALQSDVDLKATSSALGTAITDLTALINARATATALGTAITDLTALINARALPSDISTAITALIGGASGSGNTLKKLEDLIAAIEAGAGTLPPLVFDPVDGWPDRPDVDYALFWLGGDAPDDIPPVMPAGDVWIPRTGDNVDLGAIVESLQQITGTINTIPYFVAANEFSTLALITAITSAASSTEVPTALAAKNYTDKIPIARVVTASGNFSVDDKFKYVEVNSASPVTMTLQPGTLDQDEWIYVRSINTGTVTIAGTGVVAPGGRLKLAGQWSDGILTCRGTASYVFTGDATT